MRELGRQKPHIYKDGFWCCGNDICSEGGKTIKEAYENFKKEMVTVISEHEYERLCSQKADADYYLAGDENDQH